MLVCHATTRAPSCLFRRDFGNSAEGQCGLTAGVLLDVDLCTKVLAPIG